MSQPKFTELYDNRWTLRNLLNLYGSILSFAAIVTTACILLSSWTQQRQVKQLELLTNFQDIEKGDWPRFAIPWPFHKSPRAIHANALSLAKRWQSLSSSAAIQTETRRNHLRGINFDKMDFRLAREQ